MDDFFKTPIDSHNRVKQIDFSQVSIRHPEDQKKTGLPDKMKNWNETIDRISGKTQKKRSVSPIPRSYIRSLTNKRPYTVEQSQTQTSREAKK